VLDRDEDMQISGTRHPFMGRYKVGFSPEGKLLALDLQLYCNAGYSMDIRWACPLRAAVQRYHQHILAHTALRSARSRQLLEGHRKPGPVGACTPEALPP
jgi:xanthine dehydrogenase molybdopterin-binding subunit B